MGAAPWSAAADGPPADVRRICPPVAYTVADEAGRPLTGRFVVIPLDDPDDAGALMLRAIAVVARETDPALAREIVKAILAQPAPPAPMPRRRSA